jgi:hypothetical protein
MEMMVSGCSASALDHAYMYTRAPSLDGVGLLAVSPRPCIYDLVLYLLLLDVVRVATPAHYAVVNLH